MMRRAFSYWLGMRREWHRGALVLAVLLAAAPIRAEEPRMYVLGPEDVITVTVYNQPQLTGKYAIEADGMLTFPLLGRVEAGGQTLRAVEDLLRARLAKGYLKDPQVTVAIAQYRNQQVFVMGEVRQPGGFQLSGPITLIEALARAGSTTERAGQEALVVRSAAGGAVDPAVLAQGSANPNAAGGGDVLRVDLQRLQSGTLSQNVVLWPGDTLFVPRAAPVIVSGQVKSAGEYVLTRPMTVRQVIALAGGVTDRGSMRRIQILRMVDGQEVTLSANLKDLVQPGDTIVVRERLF